jgi:hypothetical protein
MSDEYTNPPIWFQQYEKHQNNEFRDIKILLKDFVDKTTDNTERLIKIETIIEVYEKDLNNLGVKNNKQHEEFYNKINAIEKKPDLTKRVEDCESKNKTNETKSEKNEIEVVKIKTSVRTLYIAFGVIVAIIATLSKLGVL